MRENTKTTAQTSECPFIGCDTELFTPEKVELLRHYATKEPTLFLQVDGFNPSTGALDDLQDPDGDEIISWRKRELMTGPNAVRVLVKPDANPATVVRILGKVADWIEREPEMLDWRASNVDRTTPEESEISSTDNDERSP